MQFRAEADLRPPASPRWSSRPRRCWRNADINEGKYVPALATLNHVLDHHGADIVPRWVPRLYELRARANAGLHNYAAAYSDLQQYVQRARAATDADRVRSGRVLRARFRVDNEIERNASLKRELSLSKERSDLQRDQLQRRTEVMAAGVALMALLIYILVTTQIHRRQLQRLATEDSLTKLPNRRRIAQLATAALAHARERNEPLTLALVDLDHFKLINDACGHAVGDRVLKELAAVTRSILAPAKSMGRWGGEEFLLLLPGHAPGPRAGAGRGTARRRHENRTARKRCGRRAARQPERRHGHQLRRRRLFG